MCNKSFIQKIAEFSRDTGLDPLEEVSEALKLRRTVPIEVERELAAETDHDDEDLTRASREERAARVAQLQKFYQIMGTTLKERVHRGHKRTAHAAAA